MSRPCNFVKNHSWPKQDALTCELDVQASPPLSSHIGPILRVQFSAALLCTQLAEWIIKELHVSHHPVIVLYWINGDPKLRKTFVKSNPNNPRGKFSIADETSSHARKSGRLCYTGTHSIPDKASHALVDRTTFKEALASQPNSFPKIRSYFRRAILKAY